MKLSSSKISYISSYCYFFEKNSDIFSEMFFLYFVKFNFLFEKINNFLYFTTPTSKKTPLWKYFLYLENVTF